MEAIPFFEPLAENIFSNFDLPMIESGSFSPAILASTSTARRSFCLLTPLHFSPLNVNVLSGEIYIIAKSRQRCIYFQIHTAKAVLVKLESHNCHLLFTILHPRNIA